MQCHLQKELDHREKKTLSPEYVDNNNFDNNSDNFDIGVEEKCIEDTNNSMENATVSDDMKTVTLHFYQPWKILACAIF